VQCPSAPYRPLAPAILKLYLSHSFLTASAALLGTQPALFNDWRSIIGPWMEMNLTQAAQRYGSILELTLQKFQFSLRGRSSHAHEQQILSKYIEELLPKGHPRTIVDIGAGNGVRWSNSYALLLQQWRVLGIEADRQKYSLLTRVYQHSPKAHAVHCRARKYRLVIYISRHPGEFFDPQFGH
jgi:hypothetical protein